MMKQMRRPTQHMENGCSYLSKITLVHCLSLVQWKHLTGILIPTGFRTAEVKNLQEKQILA